MHRLLAVVVAGASATLLLASPASAQLVQVGSASTDRLCPIAYGTAYLGPPVFFPPNAPPLPHGDPPALEGTCKRFPPLRLRLARRLTFTAPADQVIAGWFSGGSPTPLAVRRADPPPTTTWLLTLPRGSGRLVLSVRSVREIGAPWGGVAETRADYKLSIRRTAAPAPTVPRPIDSAAPEPTPFADSGR